MLMNKKLTYTAVSAVLLMVIAGCGEKPAASPDANADQGNNSVVSAAGGNSENSGGEVVTPSIAPSAEATPAPTATAKPTEPAKQSQDIEVYYTDPQQMNLIAATGTISFASESEKYSEAFKTLQSSSNAEQVPLWSGIELKSLDFKDGQIVMDIHKPDEAQLGAGGESLAISALAKTLFQFEEVKSVELLVDGEQVESLMGHVDLEHPLTRENSGL